MPHYRKRPVVVEAFEYKFGEEFPPFIKESLDRGFLKEVNIEILGNSFIKTSKSKPTSHNAISIPALDGEMFAFEGDFIIKGKHGEIYPCKPDAFHANFELN